MEARVRSCITVKALDTGVDAAAADVVVATSTGGGRVAVAAVADAEATFVQSASRVSEAVWLSIAVDKMDGNASLRDGCVPADSWIARGGV